MASEVDFYQIVYKEEQKSACYPFAKIHFNDTLTPFFENSVIAELVLSSKAEKIAVCSWKLKEKMRWYCHCQRVEVKRELFDRDFQVLSLTCSSKHHQFLNAAEKWHPGFKEVMKKILGSLGKSMPEEVKCPIYQNHFVAKSEIYKRYVNKYLVPAMAFMKEDKDCWADSKYTQLNKIDAANGEYLKSKIGVDYYPMHPFILERMFSIFCHNEGIKVTYL